MKIRLHLNECPFPPSPRVGEYLARYFHVMNRYSDREIEEELYRELSEYVGIDRENIAVYPGSSAILQTILRYARKNGLRFVMLRPSFHAMKEFAEIEDVKISYVDLKPKTFELDMDKLLNSVDKKTVLYISNPNNPTSNILIDRPNDVEKLCEFVDLLVIDEAYYEFSDVTFVDLVKYDKCRNLLLVRTLSKAFALAGARIGYAIASRELLEKLSKMRILFDVPIPSMVAAIAAIKDKDYMLYIVKSVKYLRDTLAQDLRSMGLYVVPSATNFLFVELPRRGTEVVKALRERGILVRAFDDPMIENFIRVSIGREEENRKFLESLREVLGL